MSHLFVDTERPTTEELATLYKPRGVDREPRPLNISSKVLRVRTDRLVLVGSDHTKEGYVNAFADAVHWYSHTFADGDPFTIRFFAGEHAASVKEMIWTLKSALTPDLPMIIWPRRRNLWVNMPGFNGTID